MYIFRLTFGNVQFNFRVSQHADMLVLGAWVEAVRGSIVRTSAGSSELTAEPRSNTLPVVMLSGMMEEDLKMKPDILASKRKLKCLHCLNRYLAGLSPND